MFIFGYGSLIWKAGFPYSTKQPGFILNYVRRFWQTSSDNRGTPAAPGLVVTLIPYEEWMLKYKESDPHGSETEAKVWGTLYKVPEEHVESVKAQLDHREKDGYCTTEIDVYLKDGSVVRSMLYIATTDNTSFLQGNRYICLK
jgi:glutathione-specific gamma-glutamylcyclotransferase